MINQTQITEISAKLMEIGQTKLNSFSEFETLATQKTRQAIRMIIAQWLKACEELEPEPQTFCKDCGMKANFVSKRSAMARTQFGLVRYVRAFYVCPHCHQSTSPLDERLNPYQSLARLRAKIAAGKSLPVAEMAKAWGLGSLNGMAKTPASLKQDDLRNHRSSLKELNYAHPAYPQDSFLSIP